MINVMVIRPARLLFQTLAAYALRSTISTGSLYDHACGMERIVAAMRWPMNCGRDALAQYS